MPICLVSYASARDRPGVELPAVDAQALIDDFLRRLDTESTGADAASAPFDRQLQYLALVSDAHAEFSFYQAVLDRIEKAASPDSLPALASLLNVEVGSFPGPTRETIHKLRDRASRLWYDLQWPGAPQEQRIGLALYGLHPDPPVRVHPAPAADRVRELGPAARAALYDMLRDPDLTYQAWDDEAAIYHAAKLLDDPALAPSEDDINTILSNGGTYGKSVILVYLIEHRNKRAVPALVAWTQSQQDYGRLAHLTDQAAALEALPFPDKAPLIDALVGLGDRLLDQYPELDHDESLFRLLASLNGALGRLGRSPGSARYFERYMVFHRAMTVDDLIAAARENPLFANAILDRLDWARREAEESLAAWSRP